MTVRAYIRVSTTDQAEGGYSLAAQRGKCEAWAAYQGHADLSIYEDAGLSGKRDDRPGFTALLLDLQPGDIVLTYSLSRLGRGGVVQLLNIVSRIKDAGARLVSMTEAIDTETHTGRLMLTILAALAELEVEQTRERTNMGRTEAAMQGIYPHNASSLPTGWTTDPDGRIVEDLPAADAVRFAFAQGAVPYLETVRRLIAAGYPTPRGGKWSSTQVIRIIKEEAYSLGYITYRSKTHPDAPDTHVRITAPALITPEQWRAAQRDRATNHNYRNPAAFPLSGLLRCECGTPLNGRIGARHVNHYVCHPLRRKTPACASNGRVTRVYTHASIINDTARHALAQYLTDPHDPARLASLYRAQPATDPHADTRAELERKQAALVDLYLEQLIDKATLEARRATLQAQLTALTPAEPPAQASEVTAPELAQLILRSSNTDLSTLLRTIKADMIMTAGKGVRVLHAEFPRD